MKHFYKLMLVVVVLSATVMQTWAQTMPKTDGTYYYIKFKQGENLVIKDMGAGEIMQSATLSFGDESQLFQVEAGTNENTYVITSKLGNKINWNDTRFSTDAENGINLVLKSTNNDLYAPAWEIRRELNENELYMNPFGGSVPGKQIGEWYFGSNGNSLEFATAQSMLGDKIASAKALLDNTLEGTFPGMFSTASRTELQNAIVLAEGIFGNGSLTETEYNDARYAMDPKIEAYVNSAIHPKISDDTNTYWYLIQGARPTDSYLTSTGEGGKIHSSDVIPDDTQLWKLVANGDGFALVNKVTGEYIDTDMESGNELVTKTAMPTNKLRTLVSQDIRHKMYCFWVENTEGSTPELRLHSAGPGNSYNLMNYTGNPYDNSSFLFFDYTNSLKSVLMTKIDKANELLSSTLSLAGEDFGKFTSDARATLNTAIASSKSIYDDAETDNAAISKSIADLMAAIETYKGSLNSNLESLLSSNASNYRWYWIRSTAAKSYIAGKVISSTGRAVGEKYTFEDKAETTSDAQLFRFELTEDKTAIANIINKEGNTYLSQNGVIGEDASANEGTFSMLLLTDGSSFNIKPSTTAPIHGQQNGTHIVNWNAGAGSASAWVVDFAIETSSSAIVSPTMKSYVITVENGVIRVSGVPEFEVYTLTGQQVNAKAVLEKGIYVVKIENFLQKVIVR